MITGECFCGAVKYQIDGALSEGRCCHCSRCRKLYGAASSAYAEVLEPGSFSWVAGEDKVQRFITNGDPEQGEWGLGFCKTCSSMLCGMHGGEVHGVALGSVNGDPGVEIAMHIHVGSKAPWDHIGGPAPRYDTVPDEL